jgi:hypothetical protein
MKGKDIGPERQREALKRQRRLAGKPTDKTTRSRTGPWVVAKMAPDRYRQPL